MLATPLSVAALMGKSEIAKILIEAGARLDIKTVQGTPIALAAATGRTDTVRLLIDSGANVNLNPARTDAGQMFNPLLTAISAGHTDIVELLIDAEVDVKLYLPLMVALKAGEADIDMVKLLLDNGVYRCPDPRSFPMGEITLAAVLAEARNEGKEKIVP